MICRIYLAVVRPNVVGCGLVSGCETQIGEPAIQRVAVKKRLGAVVEWSIIDELLDRRLEKRSKG